MRLRREYKGRGGDGLRRFHLQPVKPTEQGVFVDILTTITEFKNHLKAEGYAESSIKLYIFNLHQFRQYLETLDITDIMRITKTVILDYQAHIMTQPVARETKALKIQAVKRMFEYLTDTHRLLINPTDGIVATDRRNRRVQTVLTQKEMKQLLNQPNLSLPMHIRDRVIMEVMYTTGIRLDELISLEVYHVDLRDKILYIRKGKGHTKRAVPLGRTAVTYLKEYLEHIRPVYAKKNRKERRLFLNHSGYPMNNGSIQAMIRKHRIEAGIQKPVSPHTIRRSCATHLLQEGADIRYIQKLLGHRYLSTTQTYIKIMPVDVKETHDKTHPDIDESEQKRTNKKDEDQ